jgi:hypothetical protein
LETEQKTLYPFLVKIYLLCTHYFQVYVGDQGAKNYVRELRWFLIDLWWMFTFEIYYYAYWKWNHIDGGIIKMNSHNISDVLL